MVRISSVMLALLPVCHCNEFLQQFLPAFQFHEGTLLTEEDIRTSLLDEVEATLGTGAASKRLHQMEETLRPIIAALPKNQHGNLGHSAVRYALHRLFVLRHGWVIKGLCAAGGLWNATSPSGVLQDQVPEYLEQLFEKRLQGRGFGLHELAVLASTIEHLIHNEAVGRLGAAFNVYNLPLTSAVAEKDAVDVLDTYMMAYILGEDLTRMTETQATELKSQMPEIFLAWKDTQEFVHGIRQNVTKGMKSLDFGAVAAVAEKVGEDFGSFQDLECKDMKDKLVKMEYRGTGRVRLSDFYRPALDGAWTFQESAGYLRSLGILDESDPSQPSVMIANYVTSKTNCIASSGFYSVCCKNECEGLLSHLEQSIGASEAKPDVIAEIVSKLPSSTVLPQQVSANLQKRLRDIADGHEGTVPLHGRLFAQWMHHVYPRECPYPHMSGTTNSQLPDEWLVESGVEATASEEEMKQHIERGSSRPSEAQDDISVEEVMPWSSEEELFVHHSFPEEQVLRHDSGTGATRSAALLAAAGSLSLALIKMLQISSPVEGTTPSKYVV